MDERAIFKDLFLWVDLITGHCKFWFSDVSSNQISVNQMPPLIISAKLRCRVGNRNCGHLDAGNIQKPNILLSNNFPHSKSGLVRYSDPRCMVCFCYCK